MTDWKKYTVAFVITGATFALAFYAAARLNTERIVSVQATSDAMAIDILSAETQYELLGSLECSVATKQPYLSDQLNNLANRLSVAEENLGSTDSRVITLKKQYSLLEIKDYLLMQRMTQRCGTAENFILYFYSNTGNCPDCAKAGDVLTYLRNQYPKLRVYSFEYNLDVSALQTLEAVRGINGDKLPAYVIDNRAPVYGFFTFEEFSKMIPHLDELSATSTSATTTTKR